MQGPIDNQEKSFNQIKELYLVVIDLIADKQLKKEQSSKEKRDLGNLETLSMLLKEESLNFEGISNLINTIIEDPDTKRKLNNALGNAVTTDWINKIDDYEISSSKGKVKDLLTQSEAKEALYAGTTVKEIKDARTNFLVGLYERLQSLPEIDSDLKKTITMKELLGPKGVKAYKAAIAEESQSRHFRDAVFLSSTQHYDGPAWNKNLILWVGGPSASGKTYGASAAVKTVGQLMKADEGNNAGNNVVSVDGAVEREVSQMRQLVLQVALSKGYKGISDLHDNTKLGIKDKVKTAALAQGNLSLVIPETFTESYFDSYKPTNWFKSAENNTGLKQDEMIRYNKMQKSGKVVQAFAEVKCAPGKEQNFQAAVFHMGTSRAWLDKDFRRNDIKINNRDIGCESKVYGSGGFKWGVSASVDAREQLRRINPNLIYLEIKSDLIFVKKNKEGVWKEWTTLEETAPDNAPTFKLSNRDFVRWQQEEASKEEDARDLPQWYADEKEADNLAPADIAVTVGAKLQQVKPLPSEKKKSELKDKGERDEAFGMSQSQQPTISLAEEESKLKEKKGEKDELSDEEQEHDEDAAFEYMRQQSLKQANRDNFLEDEFDEEFGENPFHRTTSTTYFEEKESKKEKKKGELSDEEQKYDEDTALEYAMQQSLKELKGGNFSEDESDEDLDIRRTSQTTISPAEEKSALKQEKKKDEISDEEQLQLYDNEELDYYEDDEPLHDKGYDEGAAMKVALEASLKEQHFDSLGSEEVDISQLLESKPAYLPSSSPKEKEGERQTLRSAVQKEQSASSTLDEQTSKKGDSNERKGNKLD